MTTKHKSSTFGSSIHPRLSEVSGADKSIASSKHNTLYHFWQKSREYPTNTIVQKDINNKSGIYRKHIRNNEIYMC
ncbi:hypothetical protein B296_00030417 [Ensete ventricosum]|uniref:Uncharacterized protein n=1 Tax=Ensete ventricosum TaxID=4639 RepID=A0A426X5B5_ENSVE|nr:hypothetical protein B296_00030417 [Ensete ventricosum]